ncbi:MAG: IS4 family transposase, partial [Rhabdochlamydiaceae bacterium]|nr:IS4 family transposase [Rhabdochlamydiaceae bacterium]
AYKIGTIKDAENPIPKKNHGRMSKSLFRLGLDYFRSAILFVEKRMREFLKIVKLLTTCELAC